ncbi:MAG: selenide, water dikinase SelD, partial [Chloroflexota bacterium]
PDDSAVYKMNDEQAIIITTDFFPPVVDDAYEFGAIAAANALSDVYAMGGNPIVAINLVAYPDGLIPMEILTEIMRGGAEKVFEAGAVIAGGHTVTDKEPKYGLAVVGQVHPEKIIRKGGAQTGDKLILTKPLGVGVITTALKRDIATEDEIAAATESMMRLNRDAARAAQNSGAVHAMTDITGYGLIGHGQEMARLSDADMHIDTAALQWLPGALKHAENDVFPGGMERNREHLEQFTDFADGVSESVRKLLFDPETSGGLLIAVAADRANALAAEIDGATIIGEVREGTGQMIFA